MKKEGNTSTPIIKKHKDGTVSVSHTLQHHGIELELRATVDGWRKLAQAWLEEGEDFPGDIYWEMIMPAIESLDTKKLRGRYKDAKHFIEKIQREAAWFYAIIQFWCEREIEEWPEYLKILSKDLKVQNLENFVRITSNHSVALVLTMQRMKTLYGGEVSKYDLRPFDTENSFYRHYIHASGRVKTIKRGFLKGRTHKEVDSFVHSKTFLRRLFKIS